ncbi:hypothetical protein BLA29_014147 [Euroglyphus maynei]|uniref:Uncharacterized protein n=1 Tax=Euroglyphus maynei TaxID=6958 RepID=A0A1Y3BHF8_EURMA|nr:hypothetical protein BLA29_014147 [Euroglyphus maynei]
MAETWTAGISGWIVVFSSFTDDMVVVISPSSGIIVVDVEVVVSTPI